MNRELRWYNTHAYDDEGGDYDMEKILAEQRRLAFDEAIDAVATYRGTGGEHEKYVVACEIIDELTALKKI
jgi:hypothetical protein